MSQRLRRRHQRSSRPWATTQESSQFTLTSRQRTLTAADVDSIDAQEYTGEAIEPVVVVRNGDTVLVAGRDTM